MNTIVDLPPIKTGKDLIDFFLAEQQDLTLIEKFSSFHDSNRLPKQSKYYKELIPDKTPGKDQQLAFEVDLDACTGCKACVTGCHNLNGLDQNETWRDVGLMTSANSNDRYQQTVTTACHHCVDPACLSGCPTLAYEKDPVTGIVRHLDDQCIGCQYCVLKCPYDVPKYNERIGIVRKCDMCFSRLENNEAPACVQSCPNQAIKITVVNKSDAISRTEDTEFLKNAPNPSYTKPTTQYKTNKEIPFTTKLLDAKNIKLEHSHLPLVAMLVLTQLCVGAFVFSAPLLWLFKAEAMYTIASLCLATIISIHVGILHLGRPQYAFRAVLGYKKSWLSREIIAFGLFAKCTVLLASVSMIPFIKNFLIELNVWGIAYKTLLITTPLTGLLAVFTSIMVYHDTKRPFWDFKITAQKFLHTTMLCGSGCAAFIAASVGQSEATIYIAMPLIAYIATAFMKLKNENDFLSKESSTPTINLTAGIMKQQFDQFIKIKRAILFISCALSFISLINLQNGSINSLYAATSIIFVMAIISELMDKYLFFKTIVAPKMPGMN